MPNPERLFRDGEGAALERVARLEDENRRLRAELERLASAPSGVPRERERRVGHHVHHVPPLPGRFFVLAMALPFGLLALLLAVEPHHHARCHAPAPYGEALTPRSFHPQPFVPMSLDETPPVTTPWTKEAASCTPPIYVDEHGDRHYKLECVR